MAALLSMDIVSNTVITVILVSVITTIFVAFTTNKNDVYYKKRLFKVFVFSAVVYFTVFHFFGNKCDVNVMLENMMTGKPDF